MSCYREYCFRCKGERLICDGFCNTCGLDTEEARQMIQDVEQEERREFNAKGRIDSDLRKVRGRV